MSAPSSRPASHPLAVADWLSNELSALSFEPPVAYVYDPSRYARAGYERYCERYAGSPKRAVFLGMNPGPWGMGQTGVPFGDPHSVRGYLGIEVEVGAPARQHPKRPVVGFASTRREGSGGRVWGWAEERFGSAERFFERFFVLNHCPLLFLDEAGRNLTPDKLRKGVREPLLELCDQAMRRVVSWFEPEFVIGFGRYAENRIAEVLADTGVRTGGVLHPSPASPLANQGWAPQIEAQLADLGLSLD